MTKRLILALFALCAGFQVMTAVPARPGKFTYTQPDGTKIVLQRFGDEWNHWTTDASGHLVVKGADGFYRTATFTESSLSARRRSVARIRRSLASRARLRARAEGLSLTKGVRHIPVILAAFSDAAFTVESPAEKFDNLLNQEGYSYDGATGSVRDFYVDNSHGAFTPVFDVYGPVTLDKSMATYGKNDEDGNDVAPELALFHACKKLDGEIDFSKYDYNGDHMVDMVLFYYAGENEAEYGPEDSIWPHSWNMTYSENTEIIAGNSFDGLLIDNYFCTSELSLDDYEEETTKLCGIGTTCHEFGHSLGLPDFYDTDYGDSGTTFGANHGCGADLYSYSTMCSGPYNNAGRTPPYFNLEERLMLGWVDESAFKEFTASGSVTIPPVSDEEVAYRVPTSTEGEYFLLEARSGEGWDAYLEGGPGLLVYHIDKSQTKVKVYDGYGDETEISAHDLWADWEATNQINENAKHPCGYLVPAMDPTRIAQECYTKKDYGYDTDFFQAKPYDETKIPFPGRSGITSYAPVDWNGVVSDISFSGISYDASSGAVTLTATVPSEELDFNTIADPGNYVSGAQFVLELVEAEGRHPESVEWYYDDEPVSGTSVTLTSGEHRIDAFLTYPTGRKERLTLEISVR